MFWHRQFTIGNWQLANRSVICLLLIACFLLSSCEIINPAEDIPSYLHVDAFTVTTNAEQGSSSSKIENVWVSVDGQSLGAYQLPATLPVLASGSHSVVLGAGILVDGIAETRMSYPFYTNYTSTVNLEAGKTLTVTPAVTYSSYARMKIEDFDNVHTGAFDTTSVSDTSLIDTSGVNGMEGKFGYVILDSNRPYFECASHDTTALPGNGANVFLEMNYKCNTEFTVSTIANTSTNVFIDEILTIRTTDSWKKIYIDLTPAIAIRNDAIGWKILIKATKPTSQSTAELFFDNIKIVY
jgi:hypothetical protein